MGREPDPRLVVPVIRHLLERLADHPAVAFSRSGEVLFQTRPALALFGVGIRFGGMADALLDRGLEVHRQVLVDPVEGQALVVFTAVPGSASEERLRRLADGAAAQD